MNKDNFSDFLEATGPLQAGSFEELVRMADLADRVAANKDKIEHFMLVRAKATLKTQAENN